MSLNTLREQTQVITKNASPALKAKGGKSCEIVATLNQVEQANAQQLVLTATAMFDGPFTQKGQSDTYVVRTQAVQACHDNLKKGIGAQPDSVLVFGGAWRDTQSRQMSIGWINTAISAQKKQAGMNGHDSREIHEVYAQMPYLEFTNVNRQPNEPGWIRWGLTLDSARLRVESNGRWETKEFPRDWLAAKLQQAWEARTSEAVKINHWLPVLRSNLAIPMQDAASAKEAAAGLAAENPYYKLIVRVTDGAEVVTAYLPYKGKDTSPQDYAEKLLAKVPGFDAAGTPVFNPQTGEQVTVDRYALMPGVDNTLLLQEAAAGRVQIELLPRENLLLATKNAPGMANDVKRILGIESNQALHQQNLAFGSRREAVSRVALVTQTQGEAVYVVGGPFRLDSGPQYHLSSVPSHYLNLGVTPASPRSSAPVVTAKTPSADSSTQPAPVQTSRQTAPPASEPSPDNTSARDEARARPAPTRVSMQATETSPSVRTPAPTTPHRVPANQTLATVEDFPLANMEVDIDEAIELAQAEAASATAQAVAVQSIVKEPAPGTPGNYDPERDPLIPAEARQRLLDYGRRSAKGEQIDPPPVIKLFTPDAQATWLLTELDPGEPDIAFGLCDLGQGFPELGSVSLSEIQSVRGPLGLNVERDLHFEAEGPLSAYQKAARSAQRIVDIKVSAQPTPADQKPRTAAPQL